MSRPEIIDTAAGPAQVKRSRRKTLAISVLPDGTLELAAPDQAPLEAILPRVAKRLRWIRTQRRAFSEMNALRPALRYVNGATHRYLGRQYRLKIVKGEVQEVSLRGPYFQIVTPTANQNAVKQALEAWYRRQARLQFERRLASWAEWCRQRHLPQPKLCLRRMPKRWGSALQDGTICLNPELIKTPSVCIEYVIAHEICHLKHHNHGSAFYSELGNLCPDWTLRKKRLESMDL
ncbi:MAG: M48 family metallopeptidase [Verrucomicrobiae bacterium]|nr:M48 family metallopeptidase [Verrucomicrobiae bacterium]